MKTSNIFKVIFVALSFIATSANAQKMNPADSAAWVNFEQQVTSHLSNAIKDHHNCLESTADEIIVEDGKVVGLMGVIHPSWVFSSCVGGAYTIGDAKDTGTENRTSATAEVTVEYRAYHEHDGKKAKIGFYSALSFAANTPVTIENQRTYFYGGRLDVGGTINPCGKSQLTVAASLSYLNSVSQETYEGSNKKVDFRSNAFFPGIMAKYSHAVGYIRRHKKYDIMGRNTDGTGKLPVELFAKVRLEGGQIGKPKVSDDIITWTGWRFAVMAGVSIPL